MMRAPFLIITMAFIFVLQSCRSTKKSASAANNKTIAAKNIPARTTNGNSKAAAVLIINTKNVSPAELVKFSKTLIGTRYRYGSAIKEQGFDCSGFISYVFNHFDIRVPRSSVDFTNAGKTISLVESEPGDLILFTGSDNSTDIVGHMGIITENKQGDVKFIHSASGNSKGVMISGMSSYFTIHFVKVVRVFN